MKKYFFDNDLFKTTITDTTDYTRVEQLDKITGIEHKIILQAEELEQLYKIFKCIK